MDVLKGYGRAHRIHGVSTDGLDALEHKKNIKKGYGRLDKHSATGVVGHPKKCGNGGKFTWGGSERDFLGDNMVIALDDKDPNYDDGEPEDFNPGTAPLGKETKK